MRSWSRISPGGRARGESTTRPRPRSPSRSAVILSSASAGSGVQVFKDDDEGYVRWLGSDQQGFVVNIQRSLNPSDARLHRADCRAISAINPRRGPWTARTSSFARPGSTSLTTWRSSNSPRRSLAAGGAVLYPLQTSAAHNTRGHGSGVGAPLARRQTCGERHLLTGQDRATVVRDAETGSASGFGCRPRGGGTAAADCDGRRAAVRRRAGGAADRALFRPDLPGA
jgi:hypothetical protein